MGVQLKEIVSGIDIAANLATVVASVLAVYLFVSKRKTVSSVLKLLLNYSSQITLSELKAKLERLNDLSAEEEKEAADIINILSEIVGQLRGNKTLARQCDRLLSKIVSYTEGRGKLSEPRKRALVSELREQLRHINLGSYEDLMGDEK